MEENIILVDKQDNPLGEMEKMQAHQLGVLHRAFSAFIFNSNGELLLQQRSDIKYHSGGLWSNTCCSHPLPGESTKDAVERRLYEEMGMDCDTSFGFSFIYKSSLNNGLTEHEFDHVYIGVSDEQPKPSISEVKNWKYLSLHKLESEINLQPEKYSEWLKICLPELKKHFIESIAIP